MAEQTIIDQLLDRWEEARERGEILSPEVLCRERPELLAPAREKLAALVAVDDQLDANRFPNAIISSPRDSIPKRIRDYEIVEMLGRGSFGVVYKAHHRSDPKATVALKVIETNGPLDRMMIEPRLLSQLSKEPKVLSQYGF